MASVELSPNSLSSSSLARQAFWQALFSPRRRYVRRWESKPPASSPSHRSQNNTDPGLTGGLLPPLRYDARCWMLSSAISAIGWHLSRPPRPNPTFYTNPWAARTRRSLDPRVQSATSVCPSLDPRVQPSTNAGLPLDPTRLLLDPGVAGWDPRCGTRARQVLTLDLRVLRRDPLRQRLDPRVPSAMTRCRAGSKWVP
jgi:hypothetical protein